MGSRNRKAIRIVEWRSAWSVVMRIVVALAAAALILVHLLSPKLRVDVATVLLLLVFVAAAIGPRLRDLLPYVEAVRFAGVEFKLRQDWERLVREMEHAQTRTQQAPEYRLVPPELMADAEAVMSEAGKSPEAALLLLSSTLEKAVRQLAADTGIAQSDRPLPIRHLLEELVRRGVVDESVLPAFNDFWAVRNKVAHEAGFRVPDEYLYSLISLGSQLLKTLFAAPREAAHDGRQDS